MPKTKKAPEKKQEVPVVASDVNATESSTVDAIMNKMRELRIASNEKRDLATTKQRPQKMRKSEDVMKIINEKKENLKKKVELADTFKKQAEDSFADASIRIADILKKKDAEIEKLVDKYGKNSRDGKMKLIDSYMKKIEALQEEIKNMDPNVEMPKEYHDEVGVIEARYTPENHPTLRKIKRDWIDWANTRLNRIDGGDRGGMAVTGVTINESIKEIEKEIDMLTLEYDNAVKFETTGITHTEKISGVAEAAYKKVVSNSIEDDDDDDFDDDDDLVYAEELDSDFDNDDDDDDFDDDFDDEN